MAESRSSGGGPKRRSSWGFRRERFAAHGVFKAAGNAELHRRAVERRLQPSVRPDVRSVFAQLSNRPKADSEEMKGDSLRKQSYAEALMSDKRSVTIFRDIPLKSRPVLSRNGSPFVRFSDEELRLAAMDMANAIVLKFSTSRPKVEAVQEVMLQRWKLSAKPIVGALDGRHILVICKSESDAVELLTQESNVVGQARFRAFRWQPGFSGSIEPVVMASWVTMRGIDPSLCRPSFLREICRGFGKFLKADQRTTDLVQPGFARVCVEVNIRKPLVRGMWVGSEHWQQWVTIDYEGKVKYCLRCKRQGHSVEQCRREIARRASSTKQSWESSQRKTEDMATEQASYSAKQETNHQAKASNSRYSVLAEPGDLDMEEKGQEEQSKQEDPWIVKQRKHNKSWKKHRTDKRQNFSSSNLAPAQRALPRVSGVSLAKNLPRYMRKQPAWELKDQVRPIVIESPSTMPPGNTLSEDKGASQDTETIPQATLDRASFFPASRGDLPS